MIEKIKQNPVKALVLATGIFFIAAILFMLLPGFTYTADNSKMSASLFAFITGGKVFVDSSSYNMRVNGTIMFSFMLLIIAIVLLIILICGLFTNKFKNKTIMVLLALICVLVITGSTFILASKYSMFTCAIVGKNHITDEKALSEAIKALTEYGKLSLGAGAIISSIMMLLGAASLVIASMFCKRDAE